MIIDTAFYTLPTGQRLKFSFHENIGTDSNYFRVTVMDMELNCYKNLSEFEKRFVYGVELYKEEFKSIRFQNFKEIKIQILNNYNVST